VGGHSRRRIGRSRRELLPRLRLPPAEIRELTRLSDRVDHVFADHLPESLGRGGSSSSDDIATSTETIACGEYDLAASGITNHCEFTIARRISSSVSATDTSSRTGHRYW
jgi:hypothetical protein